MGGTLQNPAGGTQQQGGLHPTKPPGGQPGRAQSGLQPTKPPGGQPQQAGQPRLPQRTRAMAGSAAQPQLAEQFAGWQDKQVQSGLQPTKPPGGQPRGGQNSPWSGLLGALQQPQQFNPRPAWQNWGEQMQNRVNQGQGGAFRQGGRGF